jgi:hypothetical protein
MSDPAVIQELDVVSLERVAETDAHEGPVHAPGEDALYFTSLPTARSGSRTPPRSPDRDVRVPSVGV